MWIKNRTLCFCPPSGFPAQSTLAATARVVLVVALIASAQAQTFNVLHSFTGGRDGSSPAAGLTRAMPGTFYGTTVYGGAGGQNGYGLVFKLANKGSGWALTPLYTFSGGNDGANPGARVVIGPDGSLYGTTSYGGGSGCGGKGCGTIFNLRPPPVSSTNVLAPWTETVLYRFAGGNDGSLPSGDLVFDQSGNIYGTTVSGGSPGRGTVYELTPSDGSWSETVLWSFSGGNDGGKPMGGVIFDTAGNLYGTTEAGGSSGYGSVFRLAPSGSGWTEKVIYSFRNGTDGANPVGGVIFDSSGSLYCTTTGGGGGGAGTVLQLTSSRGSWTLKVLYALTGQAGGGPQAPLTIDAAGNLYGVTLQDGASGYGSVFRLTRSNGGWAYTDLHDFSFGSDGAKPLGTVALDESGNLYGTALDGGAYGFGVVYEILPLLITTSSLPQGTVDVPYSATLGVTGGLPPYDWSIVSGSLPNGLALEADSGLISGTPTTSGSFNFTAQVSDSQSPPATVTASLSITIQYAPLSITTTSLPSGRVDVSYSATLAAAGGLPPYSWALTQGSLPNGLTLNTSTGIVSGVPTTPGTFNFMVQVSDSQSPPATASAPLTIAVNSWVVFLSWNASTSPGVIGYNVFRATNSGGPYTELNSSLISVTNYTDRTVQGGHTYYYVSTAVNSEGQESVYSNQTVASIP